MGIVFRYPGDGCGKTVPAQLIKMIFHMGIIDASYCGDNDQWHMAVYAVRDTEIHVNDRICQFRIMENQPAVAFEEVEHLGSQDRGGFGSTGRQ